MHYLDHLAGLYERGIIHERSQASQLIEEATGEGTTGLLPERDEAWFEEHKDYIIGILKDKYQRKLDEAATVLCDAVNRGREDAVQSALAWQHPYLFNGFVWATLSVIKQRHMNDGRIADTLKEFCTRYLP